MNAQITLVPRRILLIEDEEAHVHIIERSFERDGAIQLTVASTIADAAAAIQRSTFDLVISDWLLPDGEAFDLLKDSPRIPLLLMTSHGNEKIAVKAIKAGALDYVVKSESSMLDMSHLAERAIHLSEQVIARERAQQQLRSSLAEKTMLLKEIHHRVKNNLQVVSALLSMQMDRSAGNADTTESLRQAHSRVMAMSLIHEQIYKSETLADLDFADYIQDLSHRLFDAYCLDASRVAIQLDIKSIHLPVDAAVPCGLIINELLSNSLKHAFSDGRSGTVRVFLAKTATGEVELAVSDNGVGLPSAFRLEESKSLGLQMVLALTQQLDGHLGVCSAHPGTVFKLTWTQSDKSNPAYA